MYSLFKKIVKHYFWGKNIYQKGIVCNHTVGKTTSFCMTVGQKEKPQPPCISLGRPTVDFGLQAIWTHTYHCLYKVVTKRCWLRLLESLILYCVKI